jgi:hypothetical protein
MSTIDRNGTRNKPRGFKVLIQHALAVKATAMRGTLTDLNDVV